jgi:hypothetical protein
MGEQDSEVTLATTGRVEITASVAALLPETPDPALARRSYTEKPYWHIERARQGTTREVPVELIVNGYPVEKQMLTADGTLRDLKFTVPIERSSWIALRILPSSHTNPVWVKVGDRPVRASRRSAQWCLQGVDQCWSQKERFIAASELPEARAAYNHARAAYRQILTECDFD